ncbi:MAG: polysaccharide biosynthesis C-terminal domain-containing protein, partial [archaeon]|nr:polysaccharide biosynthesis C-terminal domain-containing protein [archaeon]
KAKQFKTISLIKFGLPIAIFYLLINLIGSIDLFFIKALTPLALSDLFSGYYSAASTIAKIPFLLFNAILFVIFPLVSSTTSSNDLEKAKYYISNAMRYSLLFVTPLVVLISAMAPNLISLIYSDKYLSASAALQVLSFGIGFFCLFIVLCIIIQASNNPRLAVIFGAITVALDIILNMILVPQYSLLGAALATTISLFLGMTLAGAYVYFKFKTMLAIKSFIRIFIAGIILYAIAMLFPFTGILLVAEGIILVALYVAILFALRELKEKDFNVLLKMVK